MGLYDKLLQLIRDINAVSSDVILRHLEMSKIKELENLSLEDVFIAEKVKEMLRNLKGTSIQDHDKHKAIYSSYTECLVYLDIKKKKFVIDRIPEEKNKKTPDFKITYENEECYIELKTLNFLEGNLNYNEAMEGSMEATIDSYSQIKRGKRIGFGVSEIAPYGKPKKGRGYNSYLHAIESIIDKLEQNIKKEQYGMGKTILMVNATQLIIHGSYIESAVPFFTFPDTVMPYCTVSGKLWNVAFGKIGNIILYPPEFEGKPNIEGELEKKGIMWDNPFIKALCFIWIDEKFDIKYTGFMRSNEEDNPLFFYKLFDFHNDELNSHGFILFDDRERKKKEFLNISKLLHTCYEATSNKIVDKIYNSGFEIAIDTNSPDLSRINWGQKMIWLRIFKTTPPLHNLWNMLHEYGHYLSGARPVGYTELDELKREEEAWDNALQEIQDNYPILLKEIDDFKTHKEVCLGNYRLRHNDLKKRMK